jgi:hypothetical protein
MNKSKFHRQVGITFCSPNIINSFIFWLCAPYIIFLITVNLAMLSVAQNTQLRNKKWIVNNKLVRIWKETVVAKLKILSQYELGRTEDGHLSSGQLAYDWDLTPGPLKYKTGLLRTLLRYSWYHTN